MIPRVGVDLPVGIDPFLLYKSRDSEYRELHSRLLAAFNSGIAALRRGSVDEARRILDYPEVAAIGLGYTRRGKRGSGVGRQLTALVLETLQGSPELLARGVRHVEEMQLLSAGIGSDRVSDIAANVLKGFLVDYTQRQCGIWGIRRTSAVPVQHIYDSRTESWTDGYFDLPISPIDQSPILLVPRRIVRVLPWINYEDFVRTEFRAYLSARREKARRVQSDATAGNVARELGKSGVVTVTRQDLSLVERYVRSKEQAAAQAQPSLEYIDADACEEAERLKGRLAAAPRGREDAAAFQRIVLEILNYLFNPELIDGEPEVRTVEGTERRDIIFTNDSDETFWEYVRTEHSGILVMFEAKNTDALTAEALNQTATYLGDRLGTFGVIVTRERPSDAMDRKAYSIWNDSAPKRKAILFITDADLNALLDIRCQNGSPTKWMQRRYREFRTAVQ